MRILANWCVPVQLPAAFVMLLQPLLCCHRCLALLQAPHFGGLSGKFFLL
jgi:hypothetical protein